MKKLLFMTLAIFITCQIFAQNSDRLRKINAEDLPDTSQAFIKKHFGGLAAVNIAGVWPQNYSVYMESGQKLKFYLDGSLKEAEGENEFLPKSILKELPSKASAYIENKYSNWELSEIQIKNSKIQIELVQRGLTADLEFSRSGELLDEDIDD